MTATYLRTSQCDGKRAYPTLGKARTAAGRFGAWVGERFEAYRCPHCRQAHIGHKRERVAI